jgi:hypothetical protein
MSRPEFAVSQKARVTKSQKRLIGLPATEAVIKHGLDLIGQYINDYCHLIDFDEMLEQMLNYSYENKKKLNESINLFTKLSNYKSNSQFKQSTTAGRLNENSEFTKILNNVRIMSEAK